MGPTGGPGDGDRTRTGRRRHRRRDGSGQWRTPPWHERNGWERQPLIDAEGLAELSHRARSNAWEVYAITARPTGPGSTTQQQTRRWLQRHDATELSVVIDRGRRVEIARALELDWLIDDTLEHCTAAQLETSTRSIWIGPEPEREERAEAAFTGCKRSPLRSRRP